MIEGDYTQKKAQNADMQKIPEMESMDSRHFAGGSLEGGIAWYRKRFAVPKDWEEKRIYIHFDGVYRDSTVYFNEYYRRIYPLLKRCICIFKCGFGKEIGSFEHTDRNRK